MLSTTDSEPRIADEHDDTSEVNVTLHTPVSRRGFGRHLLGASAVAVLFVMGKRDTVQAAPVTDSWKLGGNSISTDGTNFIGTTNSAPLIFKTAAGERMRLLTNGRLGLGTTTPAAKLHAKTTSSPSIQGETSSTSAGTTGVLGQVTSTAPGADAAAVRGVNSGTNSNGAGVRGSHAGGGVGVHGTSASGNGVQGNGGYSGVNGQGGSYGVVGGGTYNGVYASGGSYGSINYGNNTGSTGVYASASAYGVQAYGNGTGSTGVYGQAPNTFDDLNAYGVRGVGTYGVQGSGVYMGVVGTSGAYGIFGYTSPDTQGTGAYGRGNIGVHGRSYTGYAVWGDTDSGTGVKGESYSDGGAVNAIYGEAFGASNNAVVGQANNGVSAFAIWGRSTSGWAGVFSGKVSVSGTLSKGGGSFQIDHPLEPETKYLYHSFVESPDMMNIYNGNATLDANGEAVVTMPDWFEALNMEFRYQLTPLGAPGPGLFVAQEISNNRFTIAGGKAGSKVSWQVTGIRHDAFANANRIPVEEDKPAAERGRYLHPKAHGKPDTLDIQHERVKGLKDNQRKRERDPQVPTRKGTPTDSPVRPNSAP